MPIRSLRNKRNKAVSEQTGYRYREFNLTPCELFKGLSLAESLKRADCFGKQSLHSKNEGEKRRKRRPFVRKVSVMQR